MKRLSEYVKWYVYITTSILAVCAVIFSIYNEETLSRFTLWQILLSGFLTTVVTMLMFPKECDKKPFLILRFVLHYVSLCLVMLLCGNWFGWMSFNLEGIAMMAGAVATVYLLAFGAYYLIDLKQANEINQKLKEKYEDEE